MLAALLGAVLLVSATVPAAAAGPGGAGHDHPAGVRDAEGQLRPTAAKGDVAPSSLPSAVLVESDTLDGEQLATHVAARLAGDPSVRDVVEVGSAVRVTFTEPADGVVMGAGAALRFDPRLEVSVDPPATTAGGRPTAAGAAPDVSMWGSHYGARLIGMDRGWAASTGGGHKIAVLDTGVTEVSSLDGRVRYDLGLRLDGSDADATDPHGHGTLTATVAAANPADGVFAGSCWDCEIIPIQVFDATANGYLSDVVAGIDHAVDVGADVINFSGGSVNPAPALQQSVDAAADADVLIVASAGNDGEESSLFPAAYPQVLSVAAAQSFADETTNRANGSNYGDDTDVAASWCHPAQRPDGTYTASYCGTSSAAPAVAGAVGAGFDLLDASPRTSDLHDAFTTTATDASWTTGGVVEVTSAWWELGAALEVDLGAQTQQTQAAWDHQQVVWTFADSPPASNIPVGWQVELRDSAGAVLGDEPVAIATADAADDDAATRITGQTDADGRVTLPAPDGQVLHEVLAAGLTVETELAAGDPQITIAPADGDGTTLGEHTQTLSVPPRPTFELAVTVASAHIEHDQQQLTFATSGDHVDETLPASWQLLLTGTDGLPAVGQPVVVTLDGDLLADGATDGDGQLPTNPAGNGTLAAALDGDLSVTATLPAGDWHLTLTLADAAADTLDAYTHPLSVPHPPDDSSSDDGPGGDGADDGAPDDSPAGGPGGDGPGDVAEGDGDDADDRAQDEGDSELRSFRDVPADATHADGISWLVETEVTTGCADDAFCPTDPVQRGQMATFLTRALDLDPGAGTFDDVPDGATHADGIAAVAAAGITTGCADGRFCPDQPVTRAQMATFLTRALADT